MKLKGLLEIVSSSAEFESIPIRHHKDVSCFCEVGNHELQRALLQDLFVASSRLFAPATTSRPCLGLSTSPREGPKSIGSMR
ncbi:hypothetical protein BS47DRAFT_1430095 [Hydnum rufescens UP504]|uniref:Uncharacterized protein n=1 Tax=Hydnum rufescens UP504 TaxID=1448309 RepID=A0A9P6DPX9_9AGAM|nr:hypothetical protein BS47DRAFT_1430095 [Hydnum rufescens UP504]